MKIKSSIPSIFLKRRDYQPVNQMKVFFIIHALKSHQHSINQISVYHLKEKGHVNTTTYTVI